MCDRGLEAFAIPDRVAEEPQPPLGADPRIQLADAAGGHVPRVGKQRLALGLLPLVEPHEIAVGHVDFAPRFRMRGYVLPRSRKGMSWIVRMLWVTSSPTRPLPRVTPCDQQAVFIDQRHGHAVDLQLDDPLDRLAGKQLGGPQRRNFFSSSRL